MLKLCHKRFLLIYLFCQTLALFPAREAFSQKQGQPLVDSLLSVLTILNNEDSFKFLSLNQLSLEYNAINPDSGIIYGLRALEIAEKLKMTKFIGNACNTLGTNYYSKADFPKALEYYFRGLKCYEDKNISNDKLAVVLSNIGSVYLNQNNFDKALEYYYKALPIYKKIDKKTGLANTLNGIGTVYAYQKNFESSFEYYTKAIAVNEELGNTKGTAEIFVNIGDNYVDQEEYRRALTYYDKALNLYEILGNKDGIGTSFGYKGKCYLAIMKSAGTESQSLSEPTPNARHLIDTAINELQKGIIMSREVGDVPNIIDFNLALSDAYSLSGDYKSAFRYLKSFISLKDSVFSIENNRKIIGLETKRESELKKKIEELQQSKGRIMNMLMIAGFALMAIIILAVTRNFLIQKESNRLLAMEKQKSDTLLLNILPAEVAEELKENGSAKARMYDNVTVIFTDFVNFTQIAARMSPQQVVEELDTCFKAFDEIITRHKIEKIKTIGDAYMAISGLPAANPQHAHDMVEAAIEIKKFIYKRKRQLGDDTFEIRIGIHSGSVIAGIVGVKKFAYDIWGDTVNIAARMEQSGQPGKINISEATYDLIKETTECEYRGEIAIKNAGIQKMYFVLA